MATSCRARTAKGKRCRRAAPDGLCHLHAGARGIGRPLALTPELEAQLLDALSAGAFLKEAAESVGVSERTVHRWLERGDQEGGEPVFRQFRQAVIRARAEARVGAVAVLRRAMSDDWRAAAFYLERTDPQNWGRRTALEHTGPEGGPIAIDGGPQLDLSKLSDSELEQLERLVEACRSRRVRTSGGNGWGGG